MSTNPASGENQTDSNLEDKNKTKLPVEPEVYTRIMGELKTAQAKLKLLEAEKANQEDSKLKEQNEWKTLAEQKEKALLETTAKLNDLESNIVDSFKINAFQRLLGGKIKNESYYQFVDTSAIAYNPETKRVDEESVKVVVADFIKNHSSLVEFKAGRMPNEASNGAKISTKGVEDMTTSELEQYIKNLAKSGKL